MAYETLLTETRDRVLTVTLNRPDRLNAFTTQMMLDWLHLLDAIDADDDVRAVIVTGAGRGFCAGADLGGGGKTFDASRAEKIDEHRDGGGRVTLRIFECKKPVIAAVNGPAVGVGATMTLPMDVRLASEDARFGFVFARRGIVPEAASSWFLPRVVGISQAMEWVATGRVFGAQEALAGRLVSRVLPAGGAAARGARARARDRRQHQRGVGGAGAPDAVEDARRRSPDGGAQGRFAGDLLRWAARPTPTKGVQSFLEKRAPRFTMKASSDMPAFFPWWKERKFSSE